MFATAKAGHDKNRIYIIVKEEGEYVYISDGIVRTIQNPKKKNKKHIQPICKYVCEGIIERLKTGQLIQNEEIKREIKLFNMAK